jgi:hypothetical protein
VANGDIGVLFVTTPNTEGGVAADPTLTGTGASGWAVERMTDKNFFTGTQGSYLVGSIFTKTLTTADASVVLTVHIGGGGSGTIAAAGLVVEGGSAVSCGPTLGGVAENISSGDYPLTNSQINLPSIDCGPQDLVVIFCGARPFASVSLGDSEVYSGGYPTGFGSVAGTFLQNASQYELGPDAGLAYGAVIAAGSAANGGAQLLQLTYGSSTGISDGSGCIKVGGMLSIAPAGRAVTDLTPPLMQGCNYYAYGNSLLCWVGNTQNPTTELYAYPYGYLALSPYPQRLVWRLNPAHSNNFGLAGGWSPQICGYMYGAPNQPGSTSGGYNTQAAVGSLGGSFTPDPRCVLQSGTWLSNPSIAPQTLVTLDCAGDDIIGWNNTNNSGTNAKVQNGFINSLDSMIRLVRASTAVWWNQSGSGITSISYGGSWSTVTNANFGGGSATSSTTNGNTVTIVTTLPSVDLVMAAIDNANYGTPGASFTVKVNGTQVYSGTTSDQMQGLNGFAAFLSPAFSQMTVGNACYNMGAGTHTIVITQTSTGVLMFNGVLIPASTPPWILAHTVPYFSQANVFDNLPFPISNGAAVVDMFNGYISTVCGAFTDGYVQIFNSETGWDYNAWPTDPGGMTTLQDYVHFNDQGTALRANGMFRLMNEHIPA